MVRSAAERAFLPARTLVEEIGDMMLLTGRTIWSALRPPYPYGGEFISQFLFAIRLCWFPMLVSIVMLAYGPAGLEAAGAAETSQRPQTLISGSAIGYYGARGEEPCETVVVRAFAMREHQAAIEFQRLVLGANAVRVGRAG